MSKGVNKFIGVGNLGRDPEIKAMPNGDSVATFSIAVSDSWKDKEGKAVERTEWINCVAFKRLADIMGMYVKKGSKIYVEGALRTRDWADKETGKKMYKTEIIVSEIQMLDSKADGSSSAEPKQKAQQMQLPINELDDEIPF